MSLSEASIVYLPSILVVVPIWLLLNRVIEAPGKAKPSSLAITVPLIVRALKFKLRSTANAEIINTFFFITLRF